jgi:hypothetical protein
VTVSRDGVVRGGTDPDSALSWVAGACMAAGAVGGFVVGWLYGRDQATTTSAVPWYAVLGLVVGVVLGLLVSIGSILVLVAVDRRPWASGAPLRAGLAAAGAALPITLLVEGMSGFSAAPAAVVFCVLLSATPAGVATVLVGRRASRARRDVPAS